MAYNVKFKTKERLRTGRTIRTSHVLDGKFRFRRETAPNERKDVRKRINDFVHEKRYAPQTSNWILSSGFFNRLVLGFDFYTVRSIPREFLENRPQYFEAINNYILTGDSSNLGNNRKD